MHRLTAAALAILTAASSFLAVREPETPRSTLAGLPSPAVPVLSLRRAPDFITRVIADAKLVKDLDGVLAGAPKATCLVVRDGVRQVYNRKPDEPLIPASNVKILTALAVLARLGPTETLVTTAKAASPIQADGTLDGSLYIVGGGDPVIETADYAATLKYNPTIRTPYERLADDLVARGLKRITGSVLGDESRFDARRYLPTWKPSYAAGGHVGPVSALIVNDGFAQFTPRRVAASAPATHAAAVLTELLRSRGVLTGGVPGQSEAPAGAATISELRSPPVRDLVAEMLQESDNTTAEVLVKELGRRVAGQGTTAAGLDAVRAVLSEAGVPTAGVALADGSGLDRSNRATCGAILASLGPEPLLDGLPIAGKEGTLTVRFGNHPAAGRLRAKTGSLAGVAALSGVVDAQAGNTLAFSLVANDVPNEAAGRALQDAVSAVLVRYPDAPPPAELAP